MTHTYEPGDRVRTKSFGTRTIIEVFKGTICPYKITENTYITGDEIIGKAADMERSKRCSHCGILYGKDFPIESLPEHEDKCYYKKHSVAERMPQPDCVTELQDGMVVRWYCTHTENNSAWILSKQSREDIILHGGVVEVRTGDGVNTPFAWLSHRPEPVGEPKPSPVWGVPEVGQVYFRLSYDPDGWTMSSDRHPCTAPQWLCRKAAELEAKALYIRDRYMALGDVMHGEKVYKSWKLLRHDQPNHGITSDFQAATGKDEVLDKAIFGVVFKEYDEAEQRVSCAKLTYNQVRWADRYLKWGKTAPHLVGEFPGEKE